MLQLLLGVASAQSQCLSLQGTTACPDFDSAQVWKGSAQTLMKFGKVQEFDSYVTGLMLNSATGIARFKSEMKCPRFQSREVAYLQSTICAMFVDQAASLHKCSPGDKKLCLLSAKSVLESLDGIFSDPAQCQVTNRSIISSAYTDITYFAEKGNTSTVKGCIVAGPSERQCGFSSSALADSFCNTSPTDACCASFLGMLPSIADDSSNSTGSSPTSSRSLVSALATGTLPATASTSATSSSSGPNPLLIGLSIAGLSLLAFFGCVLFYVLRRQPAAEKSISDSNSEPPMMVESMKVVYEYTANLFDEINLNVGDSLSVKCKFDDGWGFGYNMNSKQEGSFPMACVAALDYKAEHAAEPRDSWAYSKRASSMYGTTDSKFKQQSRYAGSEY